MKFDFKTDYILASIIDAEPTNSNRQNESMFAQYNEGGNELEDELIDKHSLMHKLKVKLLREHNEDVKRVKEQGLDLDPRPAQMKLLICITMY